MTREEYERQLDNFRILKGLKLTSNQRQRILIRERKLKERFQKEQQDD